LANGETRNLNNYYIVFTSNIGAGEAMRMESSAFATIERTVLRRVDQALRPELVARINEKLVFNRLPYAIQREICELMIGREVGRLNHLGHRLTVTPETVELLVLEGFHRTLGARPMRNTVELPHAPGNGSCRSNRTRIYHRNNQPERNHLLLLQPG